MKNILSILTLVLLSVAFTSCKKDYTCECVTTTNNSSSSESFTITDTKKDAEAECNEGDKVDTFFGAERVKECELK